MHNILILGAGKIGRLVACLLAESGSYQVTLADNAIDNLDMLALGTQQTKINLVNLNASDPFALVAYLQLQGIQTLISSLPYYCNIAVAEIAAAHDLYYFDLTEDVAVTQAISQLAKTALRAMVPQCGLAPGFISIAAHDLMQDFDIVDKVMMRVGALPAHANNSLKYSPTWSIEGLINQYGNTCHSLVNGQLVEIQPLEDYETIQIDGCLYEAFNTSGGLGSLANSYQFKVKTMNYKTIRYPGHCEKIRFLMNDLKLNENRGILKTIFENVIPRNLQDVVLIYIAVSGKKNHEHIEKTWVKKIYPVVIAEKTWSAIQITTAAGLCAAVDLVLSRGDYKGLILQEQFSLNDIINNRFGKYYA